MSRKKNLPEDVWKHVDIKFEDECWEWKGYTRRGYGSISLNYRNHVVHRIVFELIYGSIPKGKIVCHSCDNRRCCNPRHLWLGSPKDNTTDMITKHRNFIPFGELCGTSKLNDEKVKEIRRLYSTGEYSQKEIGTMFGVTRSTISLIISRRIWEYI